MSPVVTPGHNLHLAQHIQNVAAELWQFIPTEPAMVCQRHLARQRPPVVHDLASVGHQFARAV